MRRDRSWNDVQSESGSTAHGLVQKVETLKIITVAALAFLILQLNESIINFVFRDDVERLFTANYFPCMSEGPREGEGGGRRRRGRVERDGGLLRKGSSLFIALRVVGFVNIVTNI